MAITNEFIVHCPQETDWIMVCRKIERDFPNAKWSDGQKPTKVNLWNMYGKEACICRLKEDNYKIMQCDRDYFRDRNPSIKIISSKKFLNGWGYELSPILNTGYSDTCDYPESWINTATTADTLETTTTPGTGTMYYDCDKGDWSNEPIIKNKQNKMNIINNIFKSKENKALEYFGLGDKKELTSRGQEEFVDFLFESLGEKRREFLAKIVEAHEEKTKK